MVRPQVLGPGARVQQLVGCDGPPVLNLVGKMDHAQKRQRKSAVREHGHRDGEDHSVHKNAWKHIAHGVSHQPLVGQQAHRVGTHPANPVFQIG